MRGRRAISMVATALVVAGCASSPSKLQVRAIADPAAKLGSGSERLAEAEGQLALGNVGLAIEGFHVALREQPDSVEAMRGLAACYDSMGRTDLSRQYYEAALAVAPHDGKVLTAFAASLDAQGQGAEASEVRGEVAQAAAVAAQPAPVAVADAGASVTVALPAVRPADAVVPPDGPRLQRLSPGEVALLTSGEPAWKPTVIARTAQSTTVRWVALNDTSATPNVRLLNAARLQGLAARTRSYLLARGWTQVAIGDARAVRSSTIVLYPAGGQSAAQSLAAQFRVRAAPSVQGRQIVVLLGRDGAAGRIARAGG